MSVVEDSVREQLQGFIWVQIRLQVGDQVRDKVRVQLWDISGHLMYKACYLIGEGVRKCST